MTRRDWALKVLGLSERASEEDVREAYRDLVSIWHPDKHAHNDRVRARAEQMMKKLNTARDILFGTGDGAAWTEGDDIGPDDDNPPEDPQPDIEWDFAQTSAEEPPRVGRRWPAIGWLASSAVAATLIWMAFAPDTPTTVASVASSSQTNDEPVPTSTEVTPPPVVSEVEEPESTVFVPDDRAVDNSRIVIGKLGQAIKETKILSEPGGRVYYTAEPFEYLVLRTSDQPGTYRVLLQNGKDGYVASDDVAELPYNVTRPTLSQSDKKSSQTSRSEERGASSVPRFFTIGSTKSEVRSVQGTPTSVHPSFWTYEYSMVNFEGDLVSGYSNISKNLRVQMTTGVPKKNGTFTVGSTKQDVLAVQGTPTSVSPSFWTYEYSMVNFEGDLVSGYSNISNNLRVR